MTEGNIVSQNVETQTVLDNNIEIQVAQDVQEQITVGTPGPRGPIGPMGSGVAWRGAYDPATAYELHDAVVYLGSSYACFVPCTGVAPTETSNWELVAAKGDTGADGVSDIPGPRGYDGTPGTKGDTGITGAPGEQGVQGIQGIQGSQGETGVQGIQGTAGSNGTNGAKGDTGSQGIQGIAGPNGADGVDGVDGVTPVKGVDYVDGTDGAKGDTGSQGIQGIQGTAGAKGDKGDTGDAGAAGTTTWAGITDKPSTFTPAAHNQALATISDVTCTAAEINKLAGLTATAAELTHVHGVTSAIQTQLDGKVPLAGGTMTGTLIAPLFKSVSATVSVPNATPTTIYTFANTATAYWIVSVDIGSVNNATAWGNMALIHTDGAAAKITQLFASTYLTLSLSGLNLQVTQNSGLTQNPVLATLTRVA